MPLVTEPHSTLSIPATSMPSSLLKSAQAPWGRPTQPGMSISTTEAVRSTEPWALYTRTVSPSATPRAT